jgi:uncharacterized membrane protein
MSKIGVIFEMGLIWCGIVTTLTFEVLCILFCSHFQFVFKNFKNNFYSKASASNPSCATCQSLKNIKLILLESMVICWVCFQFKVCCCSADLFTFLAEFFDRKNCNKYRATFHEIILDNDKFVFSI